MARKLSKTAGQHGDASPKAEATVELILEIAQCFFRIRAMGQVSGLITSWGGGAFGFLRSLAILGPLTVPQIARMRPTSRQRMQRLADELAADGLVEFLENPQHRRSKLVQLTTAGASQYRDLNERLLAIASDFAAELSEEDVRQASRVVQQLSVDVTTRTAILAEDGRRRRVPRRSRA